MSKRSGRTSGRSRGGDELTEAEKLLENKLARLQSAWENVEGGSKQRAEDPMEAARRILQQSSGTVASRRAFAGDPSKAPEVPSKRPTVKASGAAAAGADDWGEPPPRRPRVDPRGDDSDGEAALEASGSNRTPLGAPAKAAPAPPPPGFRLSVQGVDPTLRETDLASVFARAGGAPPLRVAIVPPQGAAPLATAVVVMPTEAAAGEAVKALGGFPLAAGRLKVELAGPEPPPAPPPDEARSPPRPDGEGGRGRGGWRGRGRGGPWRGEERPWRGEAGRRPRMVGVDDFHRERARYGGSLDELPGAPPAPPSPEPPPPAPAPAPALPDASESPFAPAAPAAAASAAAAAPSAGGDYAQYMPASAAVPVARAPPQPPPPPPSGAPSGQGPGAGRPGPPGSARGLVSYDDF